MQWHSVYVYVSKHKTIKGLFTYSFSIQWRFFVLSGNDTSFRYVHVPRVGKTAKQLPLLTNSAMHTVCKIACSIKITGNVLSSMANIACEQTFFQERLCIIADDIMVKRQRWCQVPCVSGLMPKTIVLSQKVYRRP